MNTLLLQEKIRLLLPGNRRVLRVLTDIRRCLYEHRFLSRKEIRRAYGNPEKKKDAVAKWEKTRPYAATFLNRRIDMIRAANPGFRESAESEVFLTDVKYCYCAYGFLPFEYLNYELSSKDEEGYREYISEKEKNQIHYRLNDLRGMTYFNDKAWTYDLFGKFYHRDCAVIEKEKDYGTYQEFVRKHSVFFRKQVYGFSGHEVKRVNLASGPETARETFEAILREGKHIIEEPIRQSGEVSRFNASSVNTVRYTTILTKHGPKPYSVFFRTGRAGSYVDNAGSGGVFAGVDPETGILNTSGVDEFGVRHERHPESGVEYRDFQLPDWDQLITVCTEAAIMAGEIGCGDIGWDMAHTDEFGWVLVEANAGGQLIDQSASRKGLRDRVEKLLADV